MGRPTKLTPRVTSEIATSIRAGQYASVAAEGAGISETTYYDWLSRGRQAVAEKSVPKTEQPYVDFLEAVTRASVEAEKVAVSSLLKAMDEDWRAALAYLERRFPERWRRRTQTEVGVRTKEPIEIRLAFDPSTGAREESTLPAS